MWRARDHFDLRDRGNRGQSLAPEAQRDDPREVSIVLQFAGSVPGESNFDVRGFDAAAVVGDPDRFVAAAGHFHGDARSPGIEGVFDELLHDRGWPLDYLARSYSASDLRGQNADCQVFLEVILARLFRRAVGV